MEDFLKELGIDKLDESQQTALTEKINNIIDIRVSEKCSEVISEEKENLLVEYEAKFDEYKNDITSKFSDFVDSILTEEMDIPEKIYEFAKYGELYKDVIDQLKVKLAIDEGVLNDEVKSLLKEAKTEILSLKKEYNDVMAKNIELAEDVKTLSSHVYLIEKCKGLTEFQARKVMSILEGVTNKKEIDSKFNIIIEEMDVTVSSEQQTDNDMETFTCKECGYVGTAGLDDTGKKVCPKCGAAVEDIANVNQADDFGQGQMEVDTNTPLLDTNESADETFNENIKRWAKILKENKI